jgi:hypothetical protein
MRKIKTAKNAAPVVETPVVDVELANATGDQTNESAGVDLQLTTDELTADEETALELNTDTSTEEEVQEPAGETDEQSDEEPAEEITYLGARDEYLADTSLLESDRSAIAKGFDERAAFERSKNGFNETIHKSLDKSRAKLIQNHAVAALAVAGVAPDFMTYSTHTGSAYNVYAIDKLCDLVIALNTGVMKNAVNLAIVKSLIQLRAAGEAMTGELSKACVSQNIRVPGNANVKYLSRHTASPATAPTQASSTMQALQTLGIVKNAGSQKFPIYSMIDGPMTDRLEEVLKAA